MNKKLIRLTENDLHRIVKESVNRVLYNEGLGDRFKGAWNGFKTGNDQMQQNDYDAGNLSYWVETAQRVLQTGNPQQAVNFLKNFVTQYGEDKAYQRDMYKNGHAYGNDF